MLHFCYLLMFWCLLRYDEALNLEFHQVEMGVDELGIHYLEIRLPHRKTHQTGGQDSTIATVHALPQADDCIQTLCRSISTKTLTRTSAHFSHIPHGAHCLLILVRLCAGRFSGSHLQVVYFRGAMHWFVSSTPGDCRG